jgi:intracellular septation protein
LHRAGRGTSHSPAGHGRNLTDPGMKLLFDLFPILLFFVAYKFAGIYWATAVAIGTAALQVAWVWVRRHRVERMQLVTLGLLVVLGGLTIALHDPIFVMWKPTIVNWLFAAAFLVSQWIGDRPLTERMMGHAVTVPGAIWARLNLAWVLFFIISGLMNLFVVYWASGFYQAQQALIAATGDSAIDLSLCAERFTADLLALCTDAQSREEVWVNFKLFGMMGMTILFVIAQAFYLARHIKDEPATLETD